MTACLLHPERQSAGKCEYCAQPHCAQCLRPLLGRFYCPPCYEQVQAVARGGPRPAARAPAAGGAAPAGEAPRPRLPGWLSALFYLVGFAAVFYVAQSVLALPLLVAR